MRKAKSAYSREKEGSYPKYERKVKAPIGADEIKSTPLTPGAGVS
jgi:hypothetical protein